MDNIVVPDVNIYILSVSSIVPVIICAYAVIVDVIICNIELMAELYNGMM